MQNAPREHSAILLTCINASVTFATVVVRFICLRFSLRFFRRRRLKATTYVVTLLTITLRFLSGTNKNKTFQRPCGYRTTTARLAYNHRVIFTSSLYKSHDARTMTLQKSQGDGTLTVQLSCNYVYRFKLLSMFIFAFNLNYISKSCDHKSRYEEASVFS